MRKIEFYRHNLGLKELRYIKKCLKSIFLTSGPLTKEFENKFAEYLKVRNVVGVTSCTAGLFLALKALNIKEGDEVITTPFTFAATLNSIIFCNAKPVLVDVEPKTGNIDINLIEKRITEKTKAILPVHLYGVMCNVKKIKEIADRYNLKVVEDSAHCVEGEYEGIKPAQLSDAAAFSFYATKNITSGEGGAVATNNNELAEKIRVLRLHGMDRDAEKRYTEKYVKYDIKVLGYKFNMFDIQAALLIPQLERIEKTWKRKKIVYDYYVKKISEIEEVKIPEVPKEVKHSLHLFTIWVSPKIRDALVDFLQKNGIGVAINYTPVHLLSYYKKNLGYKEGDFPIAEEIGNKTITLPFYPKLKFGEIDYIVKKIKEGIVKLNQS